MNNNFNFSWNEFFIRLIYGGVVGSVGVTVVTPLMNFTNHVLNSSSNPKSINHFTFKRAFDGVLAYNSSVVPMTSVSLALNSWLTNISINSELISKKKLIILNATLSGMAAGFFGSFPEAVAQAQQLSNPKLKAAKIIKNVITSNGIFAIGRGIPPTMIRQGIFTAGFVGFMPLLSQDLRKLINNNLLADIFSACLCGFIVGPLTAPWNKLRFEKQKNFHIPTKAPTYFEIINNSSFTQLMSGWKPRSIMSVSSMFLLHKGRELYDQSMKP